MTRKELNNWMMLARIVANMDTIDLDKIQEEVARQKEIDKQKDHECFVLAEELTEKLADRAPETILTVITELVDLWEALSGNDSSKVYCELVEFFTERG